MYMCICICVYVYMFIYVYVYLYVYVYVYIYIYIYILNLIIFKIRQTDYCPDVEKYLFSMCSMQCQLEMQLPKKQLPSASGGL